MPLADELHLALKARKEGHALAIDGEIDFRHMQDRIRAGESTDDPVLDFVVACVGTAYEPATKPYRALQAEVREHQGGVVAVTIERETAPSLAPHASYVWPEDISVTKEEMRGQLEGELAFNVQTGELLLPTKDHRVAVYTDGSCVGVVRVEGPIAFSWSDYRRRGKSFVAGERPRYRGESLETSLSIVYESASKPVGAEK